MAYNGGFTVSSKTYKIIATIIGFLVLSIGIVYMSIEMGTVKKIVLNVGGISIVCLLAHCHIKGFK